MHCELCGKNEAFVRITGSINEKEISLGLCHGCAADNKVDAAALSQTTLSKFLEHYAEFCRELKGDLVIEHEKCPECGLSREELAADRSLGCARCAAVFREQAPAAQPEPSRESVPKLQRQLKKAVAREAYEEAAVLRDRIRDLQGEAPGPGTD